MWGHCAGTKTLDVYFETTVRGLFVRPTKKTFNPKLSSIDAVLQSSFPSLRGTCSARAVCRKYSLWRGPRTFDKTLPSDEEGALCAAQKAAHQMKRKRSRQ